MDSDARIIVAGDDVGVRDDTASLLRRAGFTSVACQAAFTFDLPGEWFDLPALIVVAGRRVSELVAEAREVPALSTVPILAVTDDFMSALVAGASDVMSLPDDNMIPESMLELARTRVRRLIADGLVRRQASELEQLCDAMVRVSLLEGDSAATPDALRDALVIAVDVMGFERASLVAHIAGSDTGFVIAATDDPTLYQLAVNLERYPEITAVIESGEPVLIDDIHDFPLTRSAYETLRGVSVRAVAVFPIMVSGAVVGVVRFRRRQWGAGHVGEHRRAFARMVATYLAARMRDARMIEGLRERTQRISRQRFEVEHRLRMINSLKQHFEAASDGVVVVEQTGRILYVNRTAEEITGYARDGLVGSDLAIMLSDGQRDLASRVIEQVLRGHNLEAFDMGFVTTSGETICGSVTTSTVLAKTGAAVFSFRDITAQRSLEEELRKTKEFLEKLVDSTVDAIIAADMRGNVLIFNQGAEQIFGYAASEVIGQMPVLDLYAPGVPRQVMRMLRSTQYGGVGRLEQTRREILSKDGALVPVHMTASIIYENGREVATVGVFSDLRDRIRIERRLLQAQQKLERTEKQALVAELAGTAAHELNQPLTSISIIAEMIERRLSPESAHYRHIQQILSETERMAQIVKKIGQITEYETKKYVGSTSILDLDASSPKHEVPDTTTSDPGLPTPVDDDEFEDEITQQVDIDSLLKERTDDAAAPRTGGEERDG